MWNMLFVLMILIVLFMMNPLKGVDMNFAPKVKQKNEINDYVNKNIQQVEYSKQLQQEQLDEVNKNYKE